MDFLHLQGVSFIQQLQDIFKGQEEWMQFMTKLGDPRAAFLVYYPLAYICNPYVGTRVLWTGAVAEFLNTVFKWSLYGHRPYWWVHITPLYHNDTPHLDQFRLTCETGPGSPSGHCMVTSAVLYILIVYMLKLGMKKSCLKTWLALNLWALFLVFMTTVGVSRCFIATHFPHQVAAGVAGGIVIGMMTDAVLPRFMRVYHFVLGSLATLGLGFGMFALWEYLDLNPTWSVALAQKWCARSQWIHLDTTPFSALIKDASALCGAGIACYLHANRGKVTVTLGAVMKIIVMAVALAMAQGSEYIAIPQDNEVVFYILSFCKMAVVVYAVVLLRRLALRAFGCPVTVKPKYS